jgi:EAL domain-containing protein (putative c-di-GMP-specific phosphodiesterase class I)
MDGTIVGFEALARWPMPGRGVVPPAEFIPVAEDTGLIGALTDWALDQGLGDLAGWREEHPGLELTLSVNITSSQIADPDLQTAIDAALLHFGLPSSSLCIEMTEGALVTDDPRNLEFLTTLRRQGVRLSIDDFGTGYSSLSALQQFPIGTLKIDQSFVRDLAVDSNDAALVRTIIDMGKSLELEVIAEGVETSEQLEFLRKHGCFYAQGRLFGEPMQADRLLGVFASQVAGGPYHAALCAPAPRHVKFRH